MEQKNFLLAMGLIIGFLLLWSVFIVPRFTPPPVPPTAAVPESGRQMAGTMAATASELKSAHAEMGESVELADTILHDENNEIVFSPKGGSIKTWRLNSKGQEVDLVLNPEGDPLPLSSFPDALYKITLGD